MKIAVLYPESVTCSWNMAHGLVATLKRMGHTVMPIGLPTESSASEGRIAQVKAACPPIQLLKDLDLILISGPEHIGPWMDAIYGRPAWGSLDVPKAAWLHETKGRDDYELDFDGFKWCADHWFWTAIQDAEFHDQEMFAKRRSWWLPLGVDTNIFRPALTDEQASRMPMSRSLLDAPVKRSPVFCCAFIGLVYPKRQAYLNALSRHKHPPIMIGSTGAAHDLHGYHWEEGARLLASNYRQIKVFVNLPALSRVLVSKVVEVMACGTFLMTPQLPPDRGCDRNMEPFTDGVHLKYYRSSNVPLVCQMLTDWISPEKDAERQKIAEAGCREVHAKHSLEVRLTEMLGKVCLWKAVSS